MLKIKNIAMSLAALLVLAGCGIDAPSDSVSVEETYEATFTDMGGNTVEINGVPEKVAIAGIPPFTSFYLQMGVDPEKIVGYPSGSYTETVYSSEITTVLENVTPFPWGAVNIEAVLATDPDVIFISTGWTEQYNALIESGIPTVGLVFSGTDMIGEAKAWYDIVGQVFDMKEKADDLKENTDRLVKIVSDTVATIDEADKKSGLMLPDYSEDYIEVSNDSYAGGSWLKSAGLTNVAANHEGWQATMENVLTYNPEVIFLSSFSNYTVSQMLEDNASPGDEWSLTTAGANGDIFKYPKGMFNWYALSPDAGLALLWISVHAYPELYTSVDLESEVKKHYEIFGITLSDAQVDELLLQN